MDDEKWSELVDQIKEQFGFLEYNQEKIPLEDDFGLKAEGIKETIVFKGALGKMKIERTSRPLITEKKVHYAKTHGSGAKIEYVFSENEKVRKIKVFKWDDNQNDWQEIKLDSLNF